MIREVLNIVSKLKNIRSAELEVKIYENTKKIFWIITEEDRSITTVLFPEE
ncbi:MAG: hypothetical protein ACFFAQ_15415 [Promethearchaeota archaeon]